MYIDKMEQQSIPQFYANKIIFIAGGSGFIGKVLIEKLLRSCPDLKKVYLLFRAKKGQNPEERIKRIIDLPLFDLVKSQNPEFSTKLEIVEGDVGKLGLGLTPEGRKKLIDEVNIVFHSAASVRFDDSLTDAILLNTRGTREVVTLALEMTKLNVLVYISTTYCNCDKKVVEEKLYPAHADWQKTIKIAENVDRHTLNALTEKYIQPLPNTYTFAKSLSEHVIYDMCRGNIPTVIYRPSIVIATAVEPFLGWVDNFNGPISLLIACGKGVMRTVYCDPDVYLDYIPVDVTVKAMIISSWKQATYKDAALSLTPSVYNGGSFDSFRTNLRDVVNIGKMIMPEVPFSGRLWYPYWIATKSYYYFYIRFLTIDLVLAVICDGLLTLFGKKPILTKIQRKIYGATMALSHFMQSQWEFVSDKCLNLQNELSPSDVDSFSYKENDTDIVEYYAEGSVTATKFLLKEEINLEQSKKELFRLWVMSTIFNCLWYLGLFWLIFVKMEIVSVIVNKSYDCFLYLTTDTTP